MQEKLTIGKLARAAGVNIESVRYYQRVGLIKEPEKPATGYRLYPDETVDRILFIKRAQLLGFSLKEIAELLELGSGHCVDIRQKAELKRYDINIKIKELSTLRDTLDELISCCKHDHDPGRCAIVETLSGK